MTGKTSALEALQRRVLEIELTGDDDLAARAWQGISAVLFDYTRERTGESAVSAADVRTYLQLKRANATSFINL